MTTYGEPEPIGNLLDSLGVLHEPESGELAAGAIVLLKVVDEEGAVTLRIATSPGMSWLERIGMLRMAEITETGSSAFGDGTD